MKKPPKQNPMKPTNILITAVTLACFALEAAPKAFGVVPPPDGGYPGFNTAEGQSALFSLDTSTGVANTAVGWFSLKSNINNSFNTAVGAGTLLFNTADENTAVGAVALLLNTIGSGNTAVGAAALVNNTEGSGNTATGSVALNQNTTGGLNTAIGNSALFSNTEGSENTAVGSRALDFSTIGNQNTAVGRIALDDNTDGNNNTAVGHRALASNQTADQNTAVGHEALFFNDSTGTGSGTQNSAFGNSALFGNTDGSGNSAFGKEALVANTDGFQNTAIGHEALKNNITGDNNTALGKDAGSGVTSANNVICIGTGIDGANVDDSCFIGNIRNALVAPDAAPVLIDSAGKLGTTSGSSRRFKKEIQPMDNASQAILVLKPVTFRYKTGDANTPQFGLLAEEVAKVNPDLVVRDGNGELLTVRYDAVNATLLNEFLKEYKKVRELEATVAEQQKSFQSKLAEQEREIQTLASGLQKVSAQFATGRIRRGGPAPQIVANGQ